MKIKTMLAVIAGALGLAATAADVTLPTGTSFEGNEAGVIQPSAIIDDATGLWSSADTEAALEVKEYGTGEQYVYSVDQSNPRLGKFDEGAQDKYLSVKTKFGSPLLRSEEVAMGDGLYFDSLVKFTACDEAPTATSYDVEGGDKAKLIVWALEDEDDGSTMLYVTAGADKNYALQAIDCSAWHRLTIKSFANVNASGLPMPAFAIFVDGIAVSCEEAMADFGGADLTDNAKEFFKMKNLFLSRDPTGNNYDKISAVGFDGQGLIDDVALTDEAPIPAAKDIEFVTIKKGEGVASFIYNDETYRADANVPKADSYSVTDVTFEDGYFGDEEQDLEEDMTVKASKKAVSINGKNYATIQEAIDAAAKAEAPEGAVITIESALTPVESIEISNSGAWTIVIDLNGKTIDGSALSIDYPVISATDALTIIDSDPEQNGRVIAPAGGDAVLMDCETRSITGGTFVGVINPGFTYEEPFITGGWYLTDVGDEGLVADGYEATFDESHDGYYKVAEKVNKYNVIFIVDGQESDPIVIEEGQKVPADQIPAITCKDWETAQWTKEGVVVDPTQVEITDNTTFTGTAFFLDQDADNNYLVTSKDDLIKVQKAVAGDETLRAASYLQTADIALSAAFGGIGERDMKDTLGSDLAAYTSAKVFKGTYDGGNKTISGVILNTGDYIGFFNSCYGATIKNLNISLGNATGWSDAASGQVGAVFAGVTVNTTLENCQTIVAGDNNTFKASKTAAGLVGFAGHGTVLKDCVNNLNIWSAGNEKAGGFIACAQAGKSTGSGVEINGGLNSGNVKNGGANAFIGGLVGYADLAVTLKGTIDLTGTTITPQAGYAKSLIHVQGGSVVLDGATITVPAGMKTVTDGKAVDGVIFATADGNVATLVKASALAASGSYKVMATGAAPVIALGAGESITFDQTLATIDAKGITAAAGYEVTKSGNTYTATVKTYNITFTTQDGTTAPEAMTYTVNSTFPLALADATTENVGIEFKGWTNATYTAAIKAIAELPATLGDIALVAQWDAVVSPVVPLDPETPKSYDDPETAAAAAKTINENKESLINAPEDAPDGFDKANYVKNFEAVVGENNTVVVQLTSKAEENLKAEVNEDVVTKIKPAELAAAAGEATLTTTPGFYYTVVAGNGIGTMAPQSCTFASGTETKVDLPNFNGAGFYTIKVSIKKVDIPVGE